MLKEITELERAVQIGRSLLIGPNITPIDGVAHLLPISYPQTSKKGRWLSWKT